jgi:hypothetical protein
MEKLSFKQYLDSREQLLKAAEHPPVTVIEYEITKYCTLYVGESKDTRELISLKPKNKIIIEWLYEELTDPQPINIQFDVICHARVDYVTFWSGDKLNKWLNRHTILV